MRTENLSWLLRWLLELAFIFGVLCLILMDMAVRRYFMWYFNGDLIFYRATLVLLYVSDINALVILRQIIGLFTDIHRSNPFVQKNVRRFKLIAVCCFAVAAAFLSNTIIHPSLLTALMVFIFSVAGLACIVFGQLFQQAVGFKSENDLTV